MLAHEKIELGKKEKRNFFSWVPDCPSHNKKACAEKSHG
jgi:hypothetical protein